MRWPKLTKKAAGGAAAATSQGRTNGSSPSQGRATSGSPTNGTAANGSHAKNNGTSMPPNGTATPRNHRGRTSIWHDGTSMSPRHRGLIIAASLAVAVALLLRGLNAPVIYGKKNKATAALISSAKKFRLAKRRGPVTGIDAEAFLQASQALIPAFDSYGPLLSRAARADLTGNVKKLRKAGFGPLVKDVGTVVLNDPDPRHIHGPTMALFWLNRILQQVAATFEELLKTNGEDVVKSATAAYLRTTAPYNQGWQRRIGKLLLKSTPNRANLIRCYGQPDFAHLKPVLEAWLRDSRSTRSAIDDFYKHRPAITPKLRWRGKSI